MESKKKKKNKFIETDSRTEGARADEVEEMRRDR